MRIFKKNKTTIATDVPAEAVRLIAQGWQEVTPAAQKPASASVSREKDKK